MGVLFFSCTKDGLPSGTPSCIAKKIEALKSYPKQNPPASVYSYTYQGKTVYYFSAPCCDQFSDLYDSNCTLICHPDGGLTGSGDGKCSDFFSTRSNEKLIWKDPR